jgi:hypothetical protein
MGSLALPGVDEAVLELRRERPGPLGVVRLEVGRRDLHAEVALAVLSLAVVADQ